MKKVLLVTSGHISSNPRLVKEAKWLDSAGVEVSIISLRTYQPNCELDQHLLDSNPNWKFFPIEIHGFGFFLRFWFQAKHNFFRFIHNKIPSEKYLFTLVSKYHSLIYREVKKHKNVDLIVGHNLAALPAVYHFAKSKNIPFGFDIEDAHSVEQSLSWETGNKIYQQFEYWVLPSAVYLTAASPDIASLYFHQYNLNNLPETILNVFDKPNHLSDLHSEKKNSNSISFYWFSQTIGLDRGLQDFIAAFDKIPEMKWELHLRGNSTEIVRNTLLGCAKHDQTKSKIFFHPQVNEADLFNLSSQHDVGIASEVGYSLNRDICLTNKIFFYMTCGIPVIYSATKAQSNLMCSHQDFGFRYESGDVAGLLRILLQIIENPERITILKKNASKAFEERYNWSVESRKYGNISSRVLGL